MKPGVINLSNLRIHLGEQLSELVAKYYDPDRNTILRKLQNSNGNGRSVNGNGNGYLPFRADGWVVPSGLLQGYLNRIGKDNTLTLIGRVLDSFSSDNNGNFKLASNSEKLLGASSIVAYSMGAEIDSNSFTIILVKSGESKVIGSKNIQSLESPEVNLKVSEEGTLNSSRGLTVLSCKNFEFTRSGKTTSNKPTKGASNCDLITLIDCPDPTLINCQNINATGSKGLTAKNVSDLTSKYSSDCRIVAPDDSRCNDIKTIRSNSLGIADSQHLVFEDSSNSKAVKAQFLHIIFSEGSTTERSTGILSEKSPGFVVLDCVIKEEPSWENTNITLINSPGSHAQRCTAIKVTDSNNPELYDSSQLTVTDCEEGFKAYDCHNVKFTRCKKTYTGLNDVTVIDDIIKQPILKRAASTIEAGINWLRKLNFWRERKN